MVVLDASVELEFLKDTSEKYLIDNIATMEQRLEEEKKMNDVNDIRELINRQNQAADLLEVADKASESFYVNTKIKVMTAKFQKLIGEIRSVLKVSRLKSHYALTKHATAAEFLFAPEEECPEEEKYEILSDAIDDIKSCIKYAQYLSIRAEYLSGESRKLQTDSRKALEEASDQYKRIEQEGRESTNQVAIEEQKIIEEEEKRKKLQKIGEGIGAIGRISSILDAIASFWYEQGANSKILQEIGESVKEKMEMFQAKQTSFIKHQIIPRLRESGYRWVSHWHMNYYTLKEIEELYNKV